MNSTSIARCVAVTAIATLAFGGIAAPSFAATSAKVKSTKVAKVHKTTKTTKKAVAATPTTAKK